MDEEDESELLTLQMEAESIDKKIKSIGRQINEFLTRQEHLSEKKKRILKKINDLEKHGAQHTTSIKEWNSDLFPWSVELAETLLKHFNISKFRALQKEAMNVTLSKEDCILIMPTGGGKSLSFQLTALLSKGFTLVISPLISLMEDQMIALRNLNINAKMLSSTTGTAHNSQVLSQMITPSSDMKILYVTPERLAKSKRFMAKLEKAYSIGNVSRIVIDEIHCVSNWGHDFRPDYQILGILKRQFPNLPLLGLTATASEKVLSDIKDILSLDTRCIVFRASFNRPNLFYEVYKTNLDQKSLIGDIAKRIKLQFKHMSGIVYCFSRKDCEEVSSGLVDHGIVAHCYHSDMPAGLKTKVHEGWVSGSVQVVVATIAFGMGIDKSNVRFVIHYSISKSMENYYQESGRAGRDDLQSWCILYFRFQDIFRQCAMVFTEKTGLENLHHMVQYSVDRQKCRRTLIGKHFAEQWKSSECKQMCDNCQRDPDAMKERSIAREATALISILQNAAYREERLTPIKLIDLWLGKGKVKDRPKDICSLPRDECEDIVTKLLIEQILAEDFHFTPYNTITYVVPGPRWPLLKHGKILIKMAVLCKKKLDGKTPQKSRNSTGTDTVNTPPTSTKKTNSEAPKFIEINLNKSCKSEKHKVDVSGDSPCKEIKNKSIDLTKSNIVTKTKENKGKAVLINSDSDSESESKGKTYESNETISKSSPLSSKHSSASDEYHNGTSESPKSNLKLTGEKKLLKNELKSCKESTNITESDVVINSKDKKQKAVLVNSDSDSESESLGKTSESNEKISNSSPLSNKHSSASEEDQNGTPVSTKSNLKLACEKKDVTKNKSKSCKEIKKESSKLAESNVVTKLKEKKRKAVCINSDSDSDSVSDVSTSSESNERTSKSPSLCNKRNTKALMMKYSKSDTCELPKPSNNYTCSKEKKQKTNAISPVSDSHESISSSIMSSKNKSVEVEQKEMDSNGSFDLKGKKRKHCFSDSNSEEETVQDSEDSEDSEDNEDK